MKLNCDLGEGFGVWKMGCDKEIMPLIDSANIACGFHASDPLIMQKTVALAVEHGVSIGAHVGYPDLVGFGRRSMACSVQEIEAFVIYQCGALDAMSKIYGTQADYVKPHGALYNDMMKNDEIFLAIARGISKYRDDMRLMILSTQKNSCYKELAKSFGIELIYEVFADRAYTKDGLLVPRTQKGSVIESVDKITKRISLLEKENRLETICGKSIELRADSICVHGDNQKAVDLVKALRRYIDA